VTTELSESPPEHDLAPDDEGRPIHWVTVAHFFNLDDAYLARLRLDEEDIPCFIADEHVTGMLWHYAVALGGAKIKVPIESAERAADTLASNVQASNAEFVSHVGTCPRCRSTHLRRGRTARRMLGMFMLVAYFLVINPLVALIGIAAGVYFIVTTLTTVCEECGYEWRASPQRGFEVLPANQDRESD
jgi:hypothetical protein